MTQPIYVPPQFDAVRDANEAFLWSGKPELLPYLATGLPLLFAAAVMVGIFIFFTILFRSAPAADANPSAGLFIFAIASPLVIIFGISLLNLVRLLVAYQQTWYAVTNKRVILRTGFWGAEFSTVDFDNIPELQVTVSFFESLVGAGTISGFAAAEMPGRDSALQAAFAAGNNRFIAIRDPYTVYRLLKETTVDVKTDWQYPNALRPDENPGYRTRYSPRR
ncbi:MAG TPA: PH domain-containing protein [Armatimonadota bacterium]|nr:PH domain-containing protein [Armatimonadota bacterium]HOS42167.1 PH domain-containing protein [Armatimonadota bacterium]